MEAANSHERSAGAPAAPLSDLRSRDLKALARIEHDIDRLGLREHVRHLDAWGYTVIKGALDDNQIMSARQAISRRVERVYGSSPDLLEAQAEDFSGLSYQPYLLYDDPVFPEILMLERPLALITYLLGESCHLSSIGSHFKGPGGEPLRLHSDNGNGIPSPFPAYSQVANVNYALTPYSKEAGALAIVPGSHRLARHPSSREFELHGEAANPNVCSMDIDPGDAVIWHGNTWHGSFRREIPGIRMNLSVYFARQYVVPQERQATDDLAALLEAHPNNARLARLLGAKQPYGWQAQGPDYTKMAQNPSGQFD